MQRDFTKKIIIMRLFAIVLCLFQFIIVKCSLKCNNFLCGYFSVCHENEMDRPTHKSSHHEFFSLASERVSWGKGVYSPQTTEAPPTFLLRVHLIFRTATQSHFMFVCLHGVPNISLIVLSLERLRANSKLLTVVMCLS